MLNYIILRSCVSWNWHHSASCEWARTCVTTQINIDIAKIIGECNQCVKCKLPFFQVNATKLNHKASEVW